jgi:heptosyltransferase-2
MKSCSLIITNDSGLMHLASALKIPIVAIFGSTIKSFGFSPFGVKNIIVENNSLNCRPCSHIGRNNCPKKHFKCMKDVTPQLVLGHLQNFMKSL